mmetsp:Transcript_9602/g.23201  ORF Transcript_9602/g.23201 Transcript_9602/m.23201 type:complete len:155 (-) Transcript_9602:41-505(-)|eukprot:2625083-Prymnesium_polylepis.1
MASRSASGTCSGAANVLGAALACGSLPIWAVVHEFGCRSFALRDLFDCPLGSFADLLFRRVPSRLGACALCSRFMRRRTLTVIWASVLRVAVCVTAGRIVLSPSLVVVGDGRSVDASADAVRTGCCDLLGIRFRRCVNDAHSCLFAVKGGRHGM